jgi:hypothetical protein
MSRATSAVRRQVPTGSPRSAGSGGSRAQASTVTWLPRLPRRLSGVDRQAR